MAQLVLVAVIIIVGSLVHVERVQSKRPLDITFGREQVINLYPGSIDSSTWSNSSRAFSQDLADTSLYQDFSVNNSAHLGRYEAPSEEQGDSTPSGASDDTVSENPETEASVPEEGSETDAFETNDSESAGGANSDESNPPQSEPTPTPEPDRESVPEPSPEPSPEPEPESSSEGIEETSASTRATWGVFAKASELFPLAQLVYTTSTESVDSAVTEQEVHQEPEPEGEIEGEEIAPAEENVEAPTEALPPALPQGSVSDITFGKFETAPLEPGQFVTGLQLRLSFGAQLKSVTTENAPFVEVLYKNGSDERSIGVILLEDQVSNALNGGYFLFALPDLTSLDELKTASFTLRYHGEEEVLDGMFLDAAWIEMNTRVVTKEDLKQRGLADKLQHLAPPELGELMSNQLNFMRTETPVFNLRYHSQRNFIVRGFRNLIGRDLVKVEAAVVSHRALGPVGVMPEITTTHDGLITIEIDKQELTKMRPGAYTIEITYDEGGKLFTDSFDFEWGILSINPHQSEYNVGATANISIGALTPNGHTICEANLDLYVTDPAGFIAKVPVEESGLCEGNNVVDVPDFSAKVPVTLAGTYELYLERLDDEGNVLGFTNDSFLAAETQRYALERNGPTRIFPSVPYEMEITVKASSSFDGVLTERVPVEFVISSTTAEVKTDGAWKVLTWQLDINGGGQETVSYGFDAPDLSPYLYNVGPASLDAGKVRRVETVASTTASSTEEVVIESGGEVFKEHRQWQIASDAVGNMIVFWDNASYIPTGWTCLSCGSGTFFQRFAYGSSTYNTTGGATTHTHTAVGSVLATGAITTESGGTGGPAIGTHTHTYTPTINSVSNLPLYRQLRVIQYTAAAGEPASLPAGAIGVFDATVPTGWTRYSAQDGYYIRGENTPGTTGGSNTHTHTITGTTGAAAGGSVQSRGGGTQTTGATAAHTHTVSGNTASESNEPRYITVILGKLNATSTLSNGMIAMWTDEVDGGWLDVSSTPGDPFNQRFLKASTTYGTTGGVNDHAPDDVSGLTSSAPSATVNARTGSAGAAGTHTHTVDVSNFSTDSHLPPYLTVVFGKRLGTSPVYNQASYRWYVNNNAQTPTDPWPVGGTDLAEQAPVTASTIPVKDGDRIRLRVNVGVTNATSTAGASFKLQYAAAATCSAGTYADVGTATSSAIWRGYNNTSVTDDTTLSSTLLASTTVAQSYEENGSDPSAPNDISVGDYGEWDFVLQHNGAAAGTNYCFRIVQSDGTPFATYSQYAQLYTNEAPEPSTLTKPFDNEKTASTTPWFFFYSTDAESDKINYQIQIDNNYDFSSPAHDLDTLNVTEDDYFENQALISDKAPFIPGDLIRVIPPSALTNGTTYYWRVRGQDPDGSGDWGDWSTIQSVTIDTSLTASAWFQTEDGQFGGNTLSGVQSSGGQVSLRVGSSSGSMISSPIDFDDGDLGSAWDSLEFADTETSGDLKYQIQYLDSTDTWSLIPDSALAGNSSGFDTSPVSLLELDTNLYNQIRIVANFTNSGGSPSLQSWTLHWGYRVEIPTILTPFANEQVSTTTPVFQFSTTDPQNDDLTYQISWSTTPDFTASTTRTSGVNSGFTNTEVGADTDPFFAGDVIQFQLQPSDALASGTTYWWRVRAKDTTGDNAYSFWTSARSFTVIPGTQVSTWFQTTEEQFDTNILSGTISLSNDVVAVATTATEAMLVYGEGTQTEPRYRVWNGSVWGSESTMQDVGAPVRWAIVRAGTTREEYVAATVGSDADVNAQVYSTGVWGNLQEMTVNMGSVSARGFDVAYETLSGDAMVAYCDGDADPSYRMWNGSSWSAAGTINLGSTNNCEWIQLASDPVSDEIIILSRDSAGSTYEAQVWNGSSWGNSTTLGSIIDAAHEGMALMYEESGGQALIVSSDGNPARFRWNSWNGTAWAGAGTVSIGDDFEWGKMVRDKGSDEILLCYQDEDSAVGVVQWSGSAWGTFTELVADGGANNKAEAGFDCVFEDSTGRSNYNITTMSNTTQTNYYTWNNAAWSAGAQVSTVGDASTMQLIRTGTANVLGLFYDDPNDSLLFSSWNGTSWSAESTLESDMPLTSTPFGQPYAMTPRNNGRQGTVVVSPGIDFDDGNGPYWQRLSWNDTTPGSSDILYRVQYQTSGGTWAFIPNSALSGNGTGFTTSPIDLSGLNTNTYNVIRPYAAMTCDGSGNCPTLSDWKVEWAGGINVSGTIQGYNQSTNVTSGTVAIAVNGVLQTGKTGAITGSGTWTITNVTAFEGDIITVFVNGAAAANEAVGVTRYDGQGDVTGMPLYERHLSIGSNDVIATPIANSDIGLYDFTNTEDIFSNVTGTTLTVCADTGCADAELYIKSGTSYTPGGRFVTHDFENNGTFTAGSFTHEINGSWDNNATTTMTGSTIVFAATSTTEIIDNTGAPSIAFNSVTMGTTTGTATFNLASTLDVNGNLTVSRGTLARGSREITVAGSLSIGANGTWTGIGTTTFDGNAAATWSDQNATKQNIGRVVVDGTSKLVTLTSNVAATSITIGANDTLDASVTGYDITVYGNWNNQNNFVARTGEVFFAATSSGKTITTTGDSFYDLTFSGSGGTWSFTESTVNVNNDFRVTAGTVTLPTATSSIAGSFVVTGGNFSNNNGVLYFTSSGPETITFLGGAFTNVAYNMTFNGSGSWTISDTNATSTNDVRVIQGTLNFPSGVFAVGGALVDAGGTFVGGTGTVLFYSAASEILTAGGSTFNNVTFAGAGSWSFSDTNVSVSRNFLVNQGTVTLPSGTLSIAGSYDNNATVTPGTGTVEFNSTDAGETIDLGASSLYNVLFTNAGGGWTITANATTTNNFTLTSAASFTLDSGRVLSVGATFTNSVGGAATTWTGSTVALRGGSYSLNAKTDPGDSYNILSVAASTHIAMWNSSAATYAVNTAGSLYSQDHNAVDGDLYIFGAYARSGGSEYWSYATDFDGTALGGGSRQVDVRFASGASASFTGSTLAISGASNASTTIANQGSGTYTVTLTGGTMNAQYYEFADLGGNGLSLLGGASVPLLDNGSFTVGAAAGRAITLSSTTIDANPSKQINYVRFATTTPITATNVAQTDGTPTSFWWFRNGSGNLYGEAYDNDTGDPGSVRFDDSSLVITISGTVYSDAGVTPITGGTCDGATQVVRVVVQGGSQYTGSCSNVNGSFSIGGIVVIGDPTVTVYLDNASGGEKGSVITRTPTADITDMDIYANRVIVRHEDVDPVSIAQLAAYDFSDDTDLRFVAATSSGATLTVLAGNELFVAATSTFTPGGPITLAANAGFNGYDGTLSIQNGATFNAYASSTNTIGGRLVLGSGATFNAASTTIVMNATTSGKSITSPNTITFHELVFSGSGGAWNLGANIVANDDITITAGTVTGTGSITLPNGSLSGNGVLSLGAGTTTIAKTNSLGGTSAWTFYNLQLGNGVVTGTTTPLFTATTTIAGRLTIAAGHFLDAGATTWDLSGTGTVFVENGTFLEDTSTVRYSGAGANVRSTVYYNLDINAGAGSQTYVGTGLGIVVTNSLTIGGQSNTTFDMNTSDPALDVNGSLTIRTNGTFGASGSAVFTLAGNYNNSGTFTPNGGTITFDGAGAATITPGSSSFSSVVVNAAGSVNVAAHATATAAWRLLGASGFTMASGQVMAVGGSFINDVGAATTWTGSTLKLYGGGNYSINTATSSDSYATLAVADTTQIRMWNSSAASYNVANTASLYSQDHNAVDGDLYIWGSYRKTTGNDFWSYAIDFDGSALGGGARKVDVFFASGASALYTGGSLGVYGAAAASTTIQNQGSGTYSLAIGGTASTSFRYYEVTDIGSNGLTFTGAPTVHTLSFGNLEVSQNGGSAMTVGGTVINANPAKNFTLNRFALNGVGSGFNVTATGTSVSAWRFTNHYGDIDGESFDVDPGGDPGYVGWDDSAALITISGRVYSDEGSTVSGVCDGSTQNIVLRVAGITTYTASCNAVTGAYSIVNVAYGVSDSLVVYIDGETEKGAVASQELISNISDFDIYENRVIVRHESTNPLSIDDMAVWDSSDDGDIPFTAVSGSPDTLTLPANRKLMVWTGKTFAPGGNVTLSGGGGGAAYDGSLQLLGNAEWTGAGSESLSVGGSLVLDVGAEFATANGTTTFTTSGAGRTIDLNEDALHNVAFTGNGSWTMADASFTANGYVRVTSGTLDLPTGTTTVNGSFINNGGTIDANGGRLYLTGSNASLRTGGALLSEIVFTGGNYSITDTHATATASVIIESGTVTMPNGTFAVGGDFENHGGAITHNNSNLILTNASAASLLASSSDLYAINFRGGGDYTMADTNGISFLDDFIISGGSDVALASGTIAVGGSLIATSGTFTNATTTFLFNSSDAGETINPGVSDFYAVQIGAPTGGYTFTGSATTTHNFTLASAASFAVQSGITLRVEGVFTNAVADANTNWNDSTLVLDGANAYSLNTKTTGGDKYGTLVVGANSDLRMWNSRATTTLVDVASSLYSQDHATVNGNLNIYGDFHIGTTTEYWSYARDFDGSLLTGVERAVTVAIASSSVVTVDGGALQIIGTATNRTTITNQGAGTYSFNVPSGTFTAQYYDMRNLDADGLNLTGAPVIGSLSYGDFELAVNNGTLISVSSTTLNANASLIITGNRFATTSAITGKNVTLTGSTFTVWTFASHSGNLDGESYDVDGVSECGSIRWNDSSCLITQQTHYRWRNDDGGVGAPNSEWFDLAWDSRKSIHVDNADAVSYSDAVVQMFVSYDTDMQADFEDLRFTSDDGVTPLPFWIGSSTQSVLAEVWVKVPSLPAEDSGVIYMYYNNLSANSSSSAEDTFIAADDFEDDDLSEYSGQLSLFDVDTQFSYDGDYGLDNDNNETSRANLGGIYRLDQTVSQGETFRYMQYIDTTGTTDETCTKFGVQSPGSANDNYAVCVELPGTDRIVLVRDAVENESSGGATTLDSENVTLATGWYEFEVDWGTDDSFVVTMTDEAGNVVGTLTATDGTYTAGGIGFTFWFNQGAWDSVSSRPTLATEPVVRFGAEQGNGGASWKAALDTYAQYVMNDTARLRIAIENSGLTINNQQFLLEYAPQGAAASCEAVNPNNFITVPLQASCGTSPVCMQSSTFVTNGASIADLLTGTHGEFTLGQLREDPSNITTSLSLLQNYYTELEYVLTPTVNTVDQNLCFRVTNNGTELDTYLRVPKLQLRFDPALNTPFLNGGLDISLVSGTTTRVYATTTVTDLNGYTDITNATSTFFRSGVGAGCAPDNNNCYVASTANNTCSYQDCSGNSCTLSCYADVYFHADPTASSSVYEGEEWYAFMEVEDMSDGYDFATTPGVDMNVLRAMSVDGAISYGPLEVLQNSGTNNASTSVLNTGNVEIDIQVEGTDMVDGYGSAIPADNQKFATSTFNYSGCGASCYILSSTTPYDLDVDLGKPTAVSPPVSDSVYWGIAIPYGISSTPHSGVNVFTPVSP